VGLDMPRAKFEELQGVRRDAWHREMIEHEEIFLMLHDHLPPALLPQPA